MTDTVQRLIFVEVEQEWCGGGPTYEIHRDSIDPMNAIMGDPTYYPYVPDKDTASRMVACWNACIGLDTEGLKTMTDIGDSLAAMRDRLLEENLKLRELVVQKVVDSTMLTGIEMKPGFAHMGFEGGACQMLAEAFADQFADSDAINYLEVHFDSERTGPLVVTMQRIDGKTPHQLRAAAEARSADLAAMLKKIVDSDDDAIAGLEAIGLPPPPELRAITEEARELINSGEQTP